MRTTSKQYGNALNAIHTGTTGIARSAARLTNTYTGHSGITSESVTRAAAAAVVKKGLGGAVHAATRS